MSGPAIYVASPLGFSAPGSRYLTEVLHPALFAAGFEVLDPWEQGRVLLAAQPPSISQAEQNTLLGAKNATLIERSVAVLAVLDGPDVDSGTAAEIGYGAGIGRVVVGLRTDFRMAGDNPAAPVNLQVLHFLHTSGGTFTTDLDEAIAALIARVGDSALRSRIFHIASRSSWNEAKATGEYRTSTREQSLEEVGFVHCSFEDQLLATANRFYADVDPEQFVVLVIEPDRLHAQVIVEAARSGEPFPHIHGPLDAGAVLATRALTLDGEGLAVGIAAAP